VRGKEFAPRRFSDYPSPCHYYAADIATPFSPRHFADIAITLPPPLAPLRLRHHVADAFSDVSPPPCHYCCHADTPRHIVSSLFLFR